MTAGQRRAAAVPPRAACTALAALLATLLAACASAVRAPEEGRTENGAGQRSGDANAEIAAAAPATDIFAVEVTSGATQAPRFAAPRNLTRRSGYDNQPAFTPDGQSFYFTSIRDGRQADLFRFELATGRTRRLTRTRTSEYSPRPVPTGGISTVRVEADGTQHLWHLGLRGGSRGALLADDAVGYHAWLDDFHLAVYRVGQPATLVVAPRTDVSAAAPALSAPARVATDVGRSLNRVPGRPWIAFVQRREEAADWIKVVQFPELRVVALAPMPAGSQDFAFAPDGSLFTAVERTLLRRPVAADARWTPVATFDHLAGAISRLTFSPDGGTLLLVAGDAETR